MTIFQCIENYRSHEVPSYWVFYAFANKGSDATLDKLIKGLQEIKRFDIIHQIYNPFTGKQETIIFYKILKRIIWTLELYYTFSL